MKIQLHAFLPESGANGPGSRACIWVKGCTLNCNGCCNQDAMDHSGGESVPVEDLAKKVLAVKGIEGVSISGGEPFQQPGALLELLKSIRERSDLSSLVFTGYTMEEINKNEDFLKILPYIDILIAGRYDQDKAVHGGLLASANQNIHFLTSRYNPADLEESIDLEIIIGEDGNLTASGLCSPEIFLQD